MYCDDNCYQPKAMGSEEELGSVPQTKNCKSMCIPALKAYLSESSDSVLIWEEWRVIANLEVKVHSLVCKGGEFVAEAEPVGAILGCCEGKAVILLLHLFVECNAFWVLQTTVHVIMATGNHLGKQKQEEHIFTHIYIYIFTHTHHYSECPSVLGHRNAPHIAP